MLVKQEDYLGKLTDFKLILLPSEIPIIADREGFPEKIVTFVTPKNSLFIPELIHRGYNPDTCILVINNVDIYKFYFKGLHNEFAFAYNKPYYKIREGWKRVYDIPSAPLDGIITRTLKFWVHGQGEYEK